MQRNNRDLYETGLHLSFAIYPRNCGVGQSRTGFHGPEKRRLSLAAMLKRD